MKLYYVALFISFLSLITLNVKLLSAAKDCNFYNFNGVAFVDDMPDSDVEDNKTFHSNTWSGHLSRISQSYNSLSLQWDVPADTKNLCAYVVHYYPGRYVGQSAQHFSVYVQPNTTNMVLTDLNVGTSYHIYIEAIFNSPVSDSPDSVYILKSWILITTTLACNCHPYGAISDQCDPVTGKCSCKTPATNGLKCDTCLETEYMDEVFGCVTCDQCDGIGSNGSCTPVQRGGMNCICKNGHVGKHCDRCSSGYYPKGEICAPCNCSGNQNTKVENYCTVNGTCVCDYHTYGDHCDQCYPGYIGDPLQRTCVLESGSSHKAGVAVLVVIVVAISLIFLIVLLRKLLCRRRQDLFKEYSGENSGINFSALVEEPDVDFHRKNQKLQMIGSSSNA